MSFDETLRPHSNFDESVVFELVGKAQEVRELRPSNFEGPVAVWANVREQKFGDTILPRHVYTERSGDEEHRVAWVYHSGIDFESGETFSDHHIACDCLLEAEQSDSQDPILPLDCDALRSVLNKRAWFVNATFRIDEVMKVFKDGKAGDYEQLPAVHDFSVRTIAYLLEHDTRHPESWVGNVITGQHQVSLLSVVMQQPPEIIRWYGELLEQTGLVEFDGETLSLTEDALAA